MASASGDPTGGDVAARSGGGRCDGAAVARCLGCAGFAIVVVYLGDRARADAVVDDVLAAGGVAVAIRADVGDPLDVARLLDETREALGGLVVLALLG